MDSKRIPGWRQAEIRSDTVGQRDELSAMIEMLSYVQREKLRMWLLREIKNGDGETTPRREQVKQEFDYILPFVDDKNLDLMMRVMRAFTKGAT